MNLSLSKLTTTFLLAVTALSASQFETETDFYSASQTRFITSWSDYKDARQQKPREIVRLPNSQNLQPIVRWPQRKPAEPVKTVIKSPKITVKTTNQASPKVTPKPWDGYFSAESFNSSSEKVELQNIKEILRSGIMTLPKSHTQSLKTLTVKNKAHQSRGLANSNTLILNVGTIDTEEELLAVFVHEMGHVTDLGTYKSDKGFPTNFRDRGRTVMSGDISTKFYKIAWKDSDSRRSYTSRNDFVSGYAMSDPFEDFAESYIFYRLHGEKFRHLAKSSDVLAKKYNFMRVYIFNGSEYHTDKTIASYANTAWDATLVNF